MIFKDPPLTAVQMLWVNLIMDTFAALALATEPPSDELFNRKPADKFDKIVSATMWRNIVGHGVYQMIVLLIFLFAGSAIFSLPYEQEEPFWVNAEYMLSHPDAVMYAPTNKCILYTMVFQTFVFMQLFN